MSDRIPMTKVGYEKLKTEVDQLELEEMPRDRKTHCGSKERRRPQRECRIPWSTRKPGNAASEDKSFA